MRVLRLLLAASLSLLLVAPAGAALIHHWSFDGNHIDTVGGNDDTVVGTEAYAPSLPGFGQAFSFDGSTYMRLDHFDRPGEMTVAAWIQTTPGVSGNRQILGWGRDSGSPRGTREFRVQDGTLTYGEYNSWTPSGWRRTYSTATVNDGDWYHVAAVREGGDNSPIRLYIDGVLAPLGGGGTAHADTPNHTNRLLIGALNNNGLTNYFNGLIDELRIYESALTQTQVAGLLVPESELGREYVAQVDFGRQTVTPPDGWNRMDSRAGVTDMGEIPLRSPDGSLTPITLTVTDAFGWTADQGPNQSITAPNGVEFPAATIVEFAGENTGGTGRNDLAVIRLASVEEYFYELTFASANTHNLTVDTLVNLGGEWDFDSRMFVGGETVTLDTASYETGFLSGWSEWDNVAGAYVLDLQVGNPSGGSSVAGLNALHIRAIPEPASAMLALLGVALLLGWRWRRR